MRRQYQQLPKRQRGAVAVVVGIAIFVLVGMIGLALDSGQLFVNKTELQNAADACALAAARELDGTSDGLARADAAGVLVGTHNLVGFQAAAVELEANDIRYGEHLTLPNSGGYVTSGDADPEKTRFVMCTVERSKIGMWFMGVRGFGDQTVRAYAVATLAPAQTACALPIGFCRNNAPPTTCPDGGAPDKYGLCIGDWRNGKFSSGGGTNGAFNWIDFTPDAGGASNLSELLITGYCDTKVDGKVKAEPGVDQSAAKAWNSRFGLYFKEGGKGNPSPTGEPPAPQDWTGFSYTANPEGVAAWPTQRNALADFLSRRTTHAPYQGDALTGLDLAGSYKPVSEKVETDRRIVPVPMINCDAWSPSKVVDILDWACVLMLHPIGKPTDTVYMEYRGLASTPGTPCASYGLGGGTFGPLVPVLVQ